jgi:hypothetical protein
MSSITGSKKSMRTINPDKMSASCRALNPALFGVQAITVSPTGEKGQGEAQEAAATHKKKGPKLSQAEIRYISVLEAMQRRGDIIEWAREPVKLRCGDGIVYTPDFITRTGGIITLFALGSLNDMTALDAVGYGKRKLIQELAEQPIHFHVIEIKARNSNGFRFISRDAKPRFLSAKERHTWATFEMIEWNAKEGAWKQIL